MRVGIPKIAAAALIVLTIAGCKQHGEADGGPSEAAAEVLPGSASDAMIQYDTLRSQPPLASPGAGLPHRVGGGTPSGDETAAAIEASGAPPPSSPTPAAGATGTAPQG